jgi:hypothetical protein
MKSWLDWYVNLSELDVKIIVPFVVKKNYSKTKELVNTSKHLNSKKN